jgi:hypothetical protein
MDVSAVDTIIVPLEGGKAEDDRTDTERVSKWMKREKKG